MEQSVKRKNYENFSKIGGIIFLLFLISMIFFLWIYQKKIPVFQIYTGLVLKENRVRFFVDDKTLQKFMSTNYLYYEDKKEIYKVEEIVKDIIKRKKNYHEITISFKEKKLPGDSIQISIFMKKIRIIEIFKLIRRNEL